MGGGRGGRARSRRDQDQADGRRPQLYRRLYANWALSTGLASLHSGYGGRGRGHRNRRGRARPEGWAPRRLCGPVRGLCAGAHHPGGPRGQNPAWHLRRDRGGDHAKGHDRAISLAADLQGRARDHAAVPCRGGRRRAHRLPMGRFARRHRDRHRGLRRQGADRARDMAATTLSTRARRISSPR